VKVAPAIDPPVQRWRIGELAERAGVSVPTIKYWIREGLLPPPPVKTGRTMAYYDQAYLDRLQLIRSLREEHFLPIRVIRQILTDRGDRPLSGDEVALLGRIGPTILRREAGDGATFTREEIIARYELLPDDLDLMVEMGLVGDARGRSFTAADAQLLDAFDAAEQVGITRDLFPVDGLGHYVELLDELAKREVRIFAHRTVDLPQAEQLRIAELAMDASAPIVSLIRRRFILRAIQTELAKKKPKKESTT
jgi:DNA-binding transcriptional MerR regulator